MRCAGCGTEHDNRTLGCVTCRDRHYKRGRRGTPARRGCAGCGGPLDEETVGCYDCRVRHYARRKRREIAA